MRTARHHTCVLSRLLALGLLGAAAAAGCGERKEELKISGDTLTIYSSLPQHGASASSARAVAAGAGMALSDAGWRAARRRVRLVELDSTRTGTRVWEPALVSANAKRTADDPTTIAYLGDLDYGASAVSVPTTNEAGVLQVSPSDGLASLTTVPPGRPQGGPARYYPTDERSFLRLAPSDLRMAEVLLARARELGARRLAVVYDGQVYARELTAQLVARARRDGPEPVATEELRGDPEGMPELAEDLAADRPDTVVYAGVAGPLTGPFLEALAGRLPDAAVLVSAGVLTQRPRLSAAPARVEGVTSVAPRGELPLEGRRVLRRIERRAGTSGLSPEALNGYEAVRLVLAAADRAGPSRPGILRSAMKHGARSSLVLTDRFYLYRLSGGRFSFQRELR
jgi:branched-chain amino acid transport system substrate-binding protein